MLPPQLVRSVNVLLTEPDQGPAGCFTPAIIRRLGKIVQLTRRLSFDEFGQVGTEAVPSGSTAEELVTESVLALNSLLVGVAADQLHTQSSFPLFGRRHVYANAVPFTVFGTPRAACFQQSVPALLINANDYTVEMVPKVEMAVGVRDVFGNIRKNAKEISYHQFPEKPVVSALAKKWRINKADIGGYLADNNVALRFENEFQAAFDLVICSRREKDMKPMFQLLEIHLNRGLQYSYTATTARKVGAHTGEFVEGGTLLDRIEGKARKLNKLKALFVQELGIKPDQLVHIHVMLCPLPDWDFNAFDNALKQCNAYNTVILDGVAALRGLGPICGTVTNIEFKEDNDENEEEQFE